MELASNILHFILNLLLLKLFILLFAHSSFCIILQEFDAVCKSNLLIRLEERSELPLDASKNIGFLTKVIKMKDFIIALPKIVSKLTVIT